MSRTSQIIGNIIALIGLIFLIIELLPAVIVGSSVMTVISKMLGTGICIWVLIFLVIGLTMSSRVKRKVPVLETIFTRLIIWFMLLWILDVIILSINNGVITIIANQYFYDYLLNVYLWVSLICMVPLGIIDVFRVIIQQRRKRNGLMYSFFFENIFGDQIKDMVERIKKRKEQRG